MEEYTIGQLMAWYHGKILRIPHGKQHPKKRYLTESQILDVFDGEVTIEEKVDGKLNCSVYSTGGLPEWWLQEDVNSKNTVHDHIIKYTDVHTHVYLDRIIYIDGKYGNEKYVFHPMILGNTNKYGTINLSNPTIKEIHTILETYSKLKSHYGSDKIEGIVCKNYEKQLMCKWINDEFEDKLV
jgi:hypothetical protein